MSAKQFGLKIEILDSSELKQFAEHNSKFDENGGKFSEGVENSVVKGEISCYEQFLLFPQSFQKVYPFTRRQILDRSKMKQSADDNLKFDKNSRKSSKWKENTVGKGEIARYEQFLLFPQCFQQAYFPGASKGVIVWEWVIQ